MKVRITKLEELTDALNPNNIAVGFEREVEVNEDYFKHPAVGERFYVGHNWSTSGVQEILSDNTFKTYSSVYKWEIVK